MKSLTTFLPLVLIVGVGYLLMVRPQRARARAQQERMSSIEPGTKVMTTAGLIAHVYSVEDNEVVLVAEDGQKLRFVRQAIGKIFPDESEGENEIEEHASTEPAAIEAAEEPSEAHPTTE